MAVNNSWRQPVTMNDWMRDIEKRLMHEERRPIPPSPTSVVGPGFRAYSNEVKDWNSDGPIVDGFFYSSAGQVVNSPEDTKNWMGITQSNAIGQGLQRVWEYIDTSAAPQPDPALWSRAFVTNADGTRNYSPWQQGGGSGGGGAGVTVQDEGTTIITTTQLDFIGAGVSAIAATGEAQITIDGSPKGTAGGALTGTYPSPTLAANSVGSTQVIDGSLTAADLAPGTIPTALPPSGPAGGDLTGTYPNPTIGAGKVTSTAILDGTIQATDIAPGVIPTVPSTLPPSGPAGGDLTGTYPNPTLSAAAKSGVIPDVYDEGVSVAADALILDFVGQGVTVTQPSAGRATVTVPGVGGTAVYGNLAVGAIVPYAGTVAPPGYLMADGSAVSRAIYSDLYAAIGTTYGAGDGSTTFNLPNLKGRVPFGLDSAQTEFDNLNDQGGTKTHAHTVPDHSHLVPDHGHGTTSASNASQGAASGAGTSTPVFHAHTVGGSGNFQSYGSGAIGVDTQSNLPPFITVNYVICWKAATAGTGSATSMNGASPALTAGVWASFTHNLGVQARHVTCVEVSSGEAREVDWRVTPGNGTAQIDLRVDVAGGRAAAYYTVGVAA